MPFRQASLRWRIGDVALAFSTAADGDLRDEPLRSAWLIRQGIQGRCAVAKQVHGTTVANIDRTDTDLSSADGLVTADPQVAIGVFGADCPGLCVIAKDVLGVAHCGWRGVARGIVGSLIETMRALSAEPVTQWNAFIGPGISGDEYEVDEPVLTAREWPAKALKATKPSHAQLDLTAAIDADLAVAGLKHVTYSGCCTKRDDRLWSYRARGGGVVQLLVAQRIN